MARNNKVIQYLVALAVSLAALTSGLTLTWTTAVIPKLLNNETDIQISASDISWIAAIASPGFMTGSLASRFVSDRFGRRATLLASSIPMTIGTIIILSTANVILMCLTRYLWGLATGMILTVSTIYLAEIADKDIRGSMSVTNRVMFNLGSFVTLAIGPFVSYDVINYLLLGLPICYFISCCLVPETPYYYLKEGKVDDARKALIRLRGIDDKKILEDELSTMRSDVKKEMRRSGSAKELFTGKRYRKAIFIATGLKIGQTIGGPIVIQHYLGTIMQDSNSNLNMATVFIIFGAMRFVVGVMSSVIADKAGRRPLLIYSFLGTGLALFVVTAYFFVQEIIRVDKDVLSSYAIVVFIGLVLTNIISTLGYNSIVYPVVGEIFPLNVKSIAMTGFNILGGLVNFLVTKTYQPLKDCSGLFGVFLLFTTGTLLTVIFVYFVVPETKGKSLGEIQVLLQGIYYDDSDEKVKAVTKDAEGADDSTELKPMIDKKVEEIIKVVALA